MDHLPPTRVKRSGWSFHFYISGNIVALSKPPPYVAVMDDFEELQSVAACLEALGNGTRLSIYRLLVRAGPKGMAVGELQRALDVPASTLTHHLSRLLWVELIHQRREGRRLICSTDFVGMESMLEFLRRECCVASEAATPSQGSKP